MAAGIMVMIKNIKLRLRRAIILCRYTPVNIRASIHLLMTRPGRLFWKTGEMPCFSRRREDPDVHIETGS
jgi:hypothetical protein